MPQPSKLKLLWQAPQSAAASRRDLPARCSSTLAKLRRPNGSNGYNGSNGSALCPTPGSTLLMMPSTATPGSHHKPCSKRPVPGQKAVEEQASNAKGVSTCASQPHCWSQYCVQHPQSQAATCRNILGTAKLDRPDVSKSPMLCSTQGNIILVTQSSIARPTQTLFQAANATAKSPGRTCWDAQREH